MPDAKTRDVDAAGRGRGGVEEFRRGRERPRVHRRRARGVASL
jgi:hypothetical protein